MFSMSAIRILARGSPGVFHSGIGAGCVRVYTPCCMRTPSSVAVRLLPIDQPSSGVCAVRSEEHTSELQSRLHLVCRLLLEKKKKKVITHNNKKEKKKTSIQ